MKKILPLIPRTHASQTVVSMGEIVAMVLKKKSCLDCLQCVKLPRVVTVRSVKSPNYMDSKECRLGHWRHMFKNKSRKDWKDPYITRPAIQMAEACPDFDDMDGD